VGLTSGSRTRRPGEYQLGHDGSSWASKELSRGKALRMKSKIDPESKDELIMVEENSANSLGNSSEEVKQPTEGRTTGRRWRGQTFSEDLKNGREGRQDVDSLFRRKEIRAITATGLSRLRITWKEEVSAKSWGDTPTKYNTDGIRKAGRSSSTELRPSRINNRR